MHFVVPFGLEGSHALTAADKRNHASVTSGFEGFDRRGDGAWKRRSL
jgi:hypothetical protein